MILRLGSKGKEVKELQEFLFVKADGHFGSTTESAVVQWQNQNGLIGDGVVGPKTWDKMGIATTDNSEKSFLTDNHLLIHTNHLPIGEYKKGPTKKEYLFLHHTAGWHDPFKAINQWGSDTRGAICTEFVLGGPSIKGNDDRFDGDVVQAFPEGGYGWHLGKNGSQYMHTNSVGIEVCNFGWIFNNKTYAGTRADECQLVNLKEEFRGYKTWHRYSDNQLFSLKLLIEHIANRDNIDVRDGLPRWIKEKGVKAFDFNKDAFYGKVKGLLTHTNTRKDKFDMFPQPELLDMLLSL